MQEPEDEIAKVIESLPEGTAKERMRRARRLHYVLGGDDGKTPIAEPDVLKWAAHFENQSRVVQQTLIGNGDETIHVSTVFIGLDMNWDMDGPPLVFETMVFGGPLDNEMDRYATWSEAEMGHQAILEKVYEALADGTAEKSE